MVKKVAIVLSGGTSLGSYIAGALDELMAAFKSSSDYEVDIITGASAGATTAAIIAHGLLYRGGQTALEDVWVRKVDIVDLLEPNIPGGEQLSMLSNRRLVEVADETLRWDKPGDAGERASFCAKDLIVAMTLANSTALPYASRLTQPTSGGEEKFIQYRHSEQETFRLNRDIIPPTDPKWQRISQVARASAAIPLVFPQVKLSRTTTDDDQYIHKPEFKGTGDFWYYDGGTFNNLPIDLAWFYASLDKDGLDDRIIVVVNPWRSSVGEVNTSPPQPQLLDFALGLIPAIKLESSTIQFENEVIRPSKLANNPPADGNEVLRALPGVDRAPVDVLDKFALVMPGPEASRLRGNHMHALGAFLDERFRDYDFRRGAADARTLALTRLNIPEYDTSRGDAFYKPDADERHKHDVSSYDKLGQITSTRDPNRNIRDVFESALRARINAILRHWNAPGPDFVLDPILGRFISDRVMDRLPGLWDL